VNLTSDQERAVAVTGIDMCVRAGAGSGKTRVLIERAVRLLTREEDPLRLSEILAITFTEKASLQMKVRLADELEKHRGPAARAQVQWAWVGTIHGFCARLLRENAVEAEVDPAFAVLDEERARALLTEVFDATAADWTSKRRGDLGLLARIDLPEPARDILRLYAVIRGAGVAPTDLVVARLDPEEARAHLTQCVQGLETVRDLLPGVTPAGRRVAEEALRRLPVLENALLNPPDLPAFESILADFWKAVPLRMKGELKEVLKAVKEEFLPGALAAIAGEWVAPAIGVLREFIVDLDRRYRGLKDETGVLDFTDLESRALDLLSRHPEVREGIAGRFRQILVDEYQDVNPLQEKIIRLLRSPGNHFAVGDVKQSIYGFRHAEPGLFKACAEEAGEEGTVDLAVNFRSSPGLVEFTNHCFGKLFEPQELVEWGDMDAGADYLPATQPEVEIMLTEGESIEDYRAREARALAGRIREIVDGGEFTLRRGSERQGERVGYRDIAILFRALGDLKTYERALEDHDVPYYVVKGGGYYQAREVVDLLDLLRIVHNPRDEIALAAVLRSPFGGLSDDALLALALARSKEGRMADLLYAEEPTADLLPDDLEKWSRFRALFLDLRDLAGRVPLRELVMTAIRRSGYGDAVWLLRGGRRHVANFRKALALAESFEGVTDLAGFVSALKDLKSREVRETEAPTGGEAEDVVRILTVHGAKGLEFPVVFLPDLSRGAPNTAIPIHFNYDAIAVKALSTTGARHATPAHSRGEEERKRREVQESLRVLYVAMTRAEEHLVLLAREERDGKGSAGSFCALQSALEIGPEEAPFGTFGRVARVIRPVAAEEPMKFRVALATRHRAQLSAGDSLQISGEEEIAWARRMLSRVEFMPPLPDGTCYQNTISELLLYASCPRCYHDRYVLGIPRDFEEATRDSMGEDRPEPAGSDELPATADLLATSRGIAVHEVLRVYDPHRKEELETVARRRLDALRPGGLPDDFTEDVIRMVRSFYESETGREVLAADPELVRREMPFFVRWEIEDPGIADLLLRGQIDLLYPRPNGGLALVDYKTGHSKAARYEVQLRAYARALNMFNEERVTDAGLVYLSPTAPARYVPINLDDQGDRELDEVAASFSRDLRRGFGPELKHSPGCPR